MSSISRKTVAWGSAAVLAVAGCAAAIVIAARGSGQAAAVASASSGQPAAAAASAPRVVSVSPAAGARHVDGAGTITVTYSGTLPAAAALPALSPAIAGSWRRAGDTAVFTPAAGFPQDAMVKVTAAQPSGVAAVSASFTTGGYHVLRLQQILAQLGYLPLTWTPAASAGVNTAAAQLAAAYTPPPGTFGWKPGYPAQLRSFWSPGKSNTLAGARSPRSRPTTGWRPTAWPARPSGGRCSPRPSPASATATATATRSPASPLLSR